MLFVDVVVCCLSVVNSLRVVRSVVSCCVLLAMASVLLFVF